MSRRRSPFTDACAGREPERTPVWFMRQAGRYLPSYRKIKAGRPVLEVAKDPESASEVVADAVKALGVDAGIIFADIMLPLEKMGVSFRIEENIGPLVSNPVKSRADADALKDLDPEADLDYVFSAIDLSIQKLGDVPLIGFSGAPFTLAAYMIEGGPSRNLEKTKAFIYSQPDAWSALMKRLTRMASEYLRAQVKRGVAAIQLFDSWVGSISPSDYDRFVLPYTREIFSSVASVPKIHFCADSHSLIERFQKTGPDVLSVDWRVPLSDAWKRCGGSVGMQGNLDPVLALVGGREMERQAEGILAESAGHSGYIFSLGHGVLKETPPEHLRQLVRLVHEKQRRRR